MRPSFLYYDNFIVKGDIGAIFNEYKNLQLSRSPISLINKDDFHNAFYLAQALKAIDLEQKCLSELAFSCMSDQRREALFSNLSLAKSNEAKLKFVADELTFFSSVQSYTSHESLSRSSSYNAPRLEPINEAEPSMESKESPPKEHKKSSLSLSAAKAAANKCLTSFGYGGKEADPNKKYTEKLACLESAINNRIGAEQALKESFFPPKKEKEAVIETNKEKIPTKVCQK